MLLAVSIERPCHEIRSEMPCRSRNPPKWAKSLNESVRVLGIDFMKASAMRTSPSTRPVL